LFKRCGARIAAAAASNSHSHVMNPLYNKFHQMSFFNLGVLILQIQNIIYYSSRRRIKHRTTALEAREKPNTMKLNAATMTTLMLRL